MLYFISLLSFWFTSFFVDNTSIPTKAKTETRIVKEPEICRMFGSVYLTKDPKQRNFAKYYVYLEKDEAYADLQVFKESNKLFADGPGLWYLTETRNFADHIFYVTDNKAFADFTIYFTTKRTFAGCQN